MKRKNQIILCSALLVMGLLIFILQLFVFEYPDGFLGFIVCLISIYLILGSILRLCKISKTFKSYLLDFLDLLFFIK